MIAITSKLAKLMKLDPKNLPDSVNESWVINRYDPYVDFGFFLATNPTYFYTIILQGDLPDSADQIAQVLAKSAPWYEPEAELQLAKNKNNSILAFQRNQSLHIHNMLDDGISLPEAGLKINSMPCAGLGFRIPNQVTP
jgi:hypothetical protein